MAPLLAGIVDLSHFTLATGSGSRGTDLSDDLVLQQIDWALFKRPLFSHFVDDWHR